MGLTCQCFGCVFADIHWEMSMYTGSHCVALDHNLVGLWFLSLHCSFLLCIRGYAGGMLVGCAWWCASVFFLVCLYMVVVSGCSQGLLVLWITFQAIYLVLSNNNIIIII